MIPINKIKAEREVPDYSQVLDYMKGDNLVVFLVGCKRVYFRSATSTHTDAPF